MKSWHPARRIKPVFQFLLLFILYFCSVLIPPILLFDYSTRLGYWWGVLLAIYYSSITLVYIRIMLKREKVWIRQQLGAEQFYKLFPGELRREQREKLRAQQKKEKERERELRRRGL